MIVPLFPLRRVFLFPGAILPLQIFEPRYLRMVEDLLDTAGRLVIGTTQGDVEPGLSGSPPVHPVAGLGEISGHERLPDGRFLIALYGLDRVRIDEIDSDRPYRRVSASPLDELPIPGAEAPLLRQRLERALGGPENEGLDIPADFPTERMIDALLMQSRAHPDEMARIFGLSDLVARAEAALGLPGATGSGS
jgi:hypothetical protein